MALTRGDGGMEGIPPSLHTAMSATRCPAKWASCGNLRAFFLLWGLTPVKVGEGRGGSGGRDLTSPPRPLGSGLAWLGIFC